LQKPATANLGVRNHPISDTVLVKIMLVNTNKTEGVWLDE